MRSFRAISTNRSYSTRIHPALTSFAEVCGTLAHLIAYVGALALLAILGIHLWDRLPVGEAVEPSASAGWSAVTRSHPAFAISQIDLPEKTVTYEILRHPLGGRKDVIRWAARDDQQGERPVAEVEIYRPGDEFSPSIQASAEISARMDPGGGRELEAAGVIDSKFGPVMLVRRAGDADGARSCLGFIKRVGEPNLQISGWSCQGDALPARRASVGCILNRLILLTAGNEPKLAELFARAELRRGSCAPSAASAIPTDWVVGAENPALRGTL
jgi:hypothetical protein